MSERFPLPEKQPSAETPFVRFGKRSPETIQKDEEEYKQLLTERGPAETPEKYVKEEQERLEMIRMQKQAEALALKSVRANLGLEEFKIDLDLSEKEGEAAEVKNEDFIDLTDSGTKKFPPEVPPSATIH